MQDSLPAEKVFDTGGYLATFRHGAKMTMGWKFNKGIQEDQNSRLTTIIGGSANGIFPCSRDSHRGFSHGEDSPNLFLALQLNLASSSCEGNMQHPLQPSYPSESSPPSFSSTFRSSLRSVAEATCVHPALCQNPRSLIDFPFLGVRCLGLSKCSTHHFPCLQPVAQQCVQMCSHTVINPGKGDSIKENIF